MNTENRTYSRFDIFQRIEHFILILSFTTLAVTGLIQKYSSVLVSLDIMNFLGGIEGTRIIHRTAATVFLVEAIYHLVVIGYKLFVQRQRASMLPGIRDGLDFIQHFLYNLGLRKNFPKMGRFKFTDKMVSNFINTIGQDSFNKLFEDMIFHFTEESQEKLLQIFARIRR